MTLSTHKKDVGWPFSTPEQSSGNERERSCADWLLWGRYQNWVMIGRSGHVVKFSLFWHRSVVLVVKFSAFFVVFYMCFVFITVWTILGVLLHIFPEAQRSKGFRKLWKSSSFVVKFVGEIFRKSNVSLALIGRERSHVQCALACEERFVTLVPRALLWGRECRLAISWNK